MLLGRLLKRLGNEDNADIKKNADAGFQRNQGKHSLNRPGEADHGNEKTVQNRVPRARAQPFPAWMADVDRRGKTRAADGSDDGADSVGREARRRGIAIAGRLRALKILKAPDEIEQAHRQDDAELREQDLARLPEGVDVQSRRMPAERRKRFRECRRIQTDQSRRPSQCGSDQDREQPAGDRKVNAAEIREQDDAERHECHDRIFIGAKQKAEGDEGQADAGQRRKQRRARQPPTQWIGEHAADQLDDA